MYFKYKFNYFFIIKDTLNITKIVISLLIIYNKSKIIQKSDLANYF